MQNRNGTITPAMQHGVTVMVACLIITMQTRVRPTLFKCMSDTLYQSQGCFVYSCPLNGPISHMSVYYEVMDWYNIRKRNYSSIHCFYDFAHKQDSQLNSLVLITVWRVVIEVWQDSQLNSSAFSHCSVWRVAIGKGVLCMAKQCKVCVRELACTSDTKIVNYFIFT